VIVDLGKIIGIVPSSEQVRRDFYRPGTRMKFYVLSIDMGPRGPEIVLSRSSNKMVESVFEHEIPEVAEGSVEIKGIARDPGNRSKVAVYTDDESIDPIGACIGQRGSRITTIIDELGGEKIDVIQWSDDASSFIKQALSPAKVSAVELSEEEKEATVKVEEDQFSLAIGRGGQNVRLAAALTGWKIKVVQEGAEVEVSSEEGEEDIKKKLEEGEEEASTKESADDEKEDSEGTDPANSAGARDLSVQEEEKQEEESKESEEKESAMVEPPSEEEEKEEGKDDKREPKNDEEK
jgi:N utilization substance protein A